MGGQGARVPMCHLCEWRERGVFRGLDNMTLIRVSENKRGLFFSKGSYIFREGHFPEYLFCIHSGKAKVVKQAGEVEHVVRVAGEGQLLGYRSVVSNTRYKASAVALTDVVVCALKLDIIRELIQREPSFTRELLNILAEDLRRAEQKLAMLSGLSVKERIVNTLLWLANSYGKDEEGFIAFPLKRTELAALVGSAVETVIRKLHELEKAGLIRMRGRRIAIVDEERLSMEAGLED